MINPWNIKIGHFFFISFHSIFLKKIHQVIINTFKYQNLVIIISNAYGTNIRDFTWLKVGIFIETIIIQRWFLIIIIDVSVPTWNESFTWSSLGAYPYWSIFILEVTCSLFLTPILFNFISRIVSNTLQLPQNDL